ncbi:hypothetical protein MTR_3g053410 [Medicago truncatula]|uniref:Uncharacterized protein n=1 Tax=Medicago truncatula TaxID=3880 RepID=A0A072UXU2_MEDTR|nr:hypothetical protein MTR_3g053410 [Medicago truncatula]
MKQTVLSGETRKVKHIGVEFMSIVMSDPLCDGVACRNCYNYMNKILGKWIGAYDSAMHLQASSWSENVILPKAQELYASGKNVQFNLMARSPSSTTYMVVKQEEILAQEVVDLKDLTRVMHVAQTL